LIQATAHAHAHAYGQEYALSVHAALQILQPTTKWHSNKQQAAIPNITGWQRGRETQMQPPALEPPLNAHRIFLV
jgi:hypothetical protein